MVGNNNSLCFEDEVTTWYYSTQLIEDREDHDVDIFHIIQKVQDNVIHLKLDEEQIADHTSK